MRALVTGVAGFIGSHLVERLAAEGHSVVGVDCLTSYYDREQKRANLGRLNGLPDCDVVEADLRTTELAPLLEGIDVVFHQAGQPGVRASWASGFTSYVEHNVLATQRLLEAVREHPVARFVFASSSSVYGNAAAYPTTEDDLPRPQSPYGVTKLAAEHLCGVYARTWDVPSVSLRYFTVYGPRQRPDMAMHKLIEAALSSEPFPMYGDGHQVRDFTFVDDVVAANIRAAVSAVPAGSVINVAGGSSITLLEVVETVGQLVGRSVELERRPPQPGDVARTGGSTDRARDLLGWEPTVPFRAGLAE
ncbi:MAG: GDP-mannose 4,6-dehydratase, partial [Actinomycetota bacterium]|nr:GDP-mannose 4,6-dehydratase [Actinomycetota bacterium]